MTNEELVKLYQEGDKHTLETLLEANKGFIYKVSMKFFTGHDNSIDQDDLIQEGRIGMIKAADKYKIGMETSFTSYAYYWVYQTMYRFMYPKRNMINSKLRFVSLNVPVGEDGETELGDVLADGKDEFCSVEESIYHQELNRELRQAMNDNLNEEEMNVIFLRYGFNSNICTLEQTGEKLGFSCARARELERQSLRRLRSSRWGRMRMSERKKERL